MGDLEAIGFVARPVQQDPNRSVGVVIKQLRQRCYGGSEDIYGNRITEDKECCSYIEHCEGVVQANIDDDYSTFGSDPIALSCSDCNSSCKMVLCMVYLFRNKVRSSRPFLRWSIACPK